MSTMPTVILTSPLEDSPVDDATRRAWHVGRRVGAVVTALLLTLGAALWHASGAIGEETFRARPAPYWPVYDDVQVVAVEAGQVGLVPGPGEGPPPDADGLYGLAWNGGAGLLGAARTAPGGMVVRELTLVAGALPEVGVQASIESSYWVGEPSGLGLWYRNVLIAGSYPAWFVEAADATTVAVVVHGRNGSRRDGLRVVEALHRLGVSALVISHRNDATALSGGTGRLGYGTSEWPDLEAAVTWAVHQGATDVVLVGQSMGGAVVAAFLEESPLARVVSRVVLDAPILSAEQVARSGSARALGLGAELPEPALTAAVLLAGARWGVDWGAADYLDDTSWVRTPTLVFHGTADPVVPLSQSRSLADAAPHLVTVAEVPGAGHLESWNVDRRAWTVALAAFMGATAE